MHCTFRYGLIAFCVLASATGQEAQANRVRSVGKAVRPQVAKPQKTKIGRAKRKTVVHPRLLRLPKVRALPASVAEVKSGLKRYRNVRNRIRELRSKMKHQSIKVTTLAKVGSFVVDRLDFSQGASPGSAPKLKVLVVGGVHAGSERVGVESALRFAESLGHNSQLLNTFDITVVPLVNPSGLVIRSRRNKGDLDINRSFSPGSWTAESKAMSRMMKKEKFDVVLDLHGAGKFRTGFFVIRGANDRGLAARFTSAIPGLPLLDVKGAGKTYSLDAPGVVTSTNQGTLKQFAISMGTVRSYTFEAPARLSADAQIGGTLKLIHSALREIGASRTTF